MGVNGIIYINCITLIPNIPRTMNPINVTRPIIESKERMPLGEFNPNSDLSTYLSMAVKPAINKSGLDLRLKYSWGVKVSGRLKGYAV